MRKLMRICVVVAVMATASKVHADFTIHSDFASFSTAAGSPLFTQDLQTYSPGDNLDGVELLPGLSVTSNASVVEAWPGVVLFARDLSGNPTRQAGELYYDINLSDLYNAVSFDIVGWNPDAPGPGTMEIFFADYTSASQDLYQTGPTEQTPVFFGITSDILITRIRWNEGPEVYGYGNEETALDNFAVTPNQSPVAICQGAVVAVGNIPDIDGGSYDPDEGDTITISQEPSGAFDEPGIYEVTLTVTDSHGASDSCTAMVVVYDPSAGFVTGGGWIDSPEGAYKPDLSLAGKANFGFVSKYKKGANTPTGNTEFQFKAVDLNFHSTSYDWLLVTGSNYARFKGMGTINGEGDFKFMLWAGDDEPDTFRIKIWEENNAEVVVYDNGFDQAIGGGSIVIHTK